jgi:hypothetical protein
MKKKSGTVALLEKDFDYLWNKYRCTPEEIYMGSPFGLMAKITKSGVWVEIAKDRKGFPKTWALLDRKDTMIFWRWFDDLTSGKTKFGKWFEAYPKKHPEKIEKRIKHV